MLSFVPRAQLYLHINTDGAIKYTKSGKAEVATLLEESTFTSHS